MNGELKKKKLNIENLDVVSGGTSNGDCVDVFPDAMCRKPKGSFKVLEHNESIWKHEGCPEKCKYCWNLKYKDGFYCNV